ncbi:MAG: C25 family cysteine peptidase [Candidatus Methanofastidiosia archaeon]
MKLKFVSALLVFLLSVSMAAASLEPDTFSVDYQFEAVEVEGQWMIKDTLLREVPGEPLMPYKPAQILLPQGSEVTEITILTSDPYIETGYDIPWGQMPSTFSNAESSEKVDRNIAVYSSDDWYLGMLYEYVSVESFRGYDILCINLFPVDYKPLSQTVKFYEKMTVVVHYTEGEPTEMCRNIAEDRAAIAGMVHNAETLHTYAEATDQCAPYLPGGPYEYVIITSSSLEPIFWQLADWKSNFVNGATVVTVDWIYNEFSGSDNQEKIRKFIRAAYFSWNTSYCLLGGDVLAVPYRGFYVTAENEVDYDMAADMYYGCLDGTFNADGDNRFAEPEDNVDWLEEVFIGRAPVFLGCEAQNFVNKVIAYEQSDRQNIIQVHASFLKPGNDPECRDIPWAFYQWIPPDYTIKELFETDGKITKDDWRSAWNGVYDGPPYYPPLIFQHAGHGGTQAYYINYEVGGNVTWYNWDVPTLTNNNFWPLHTSVACHSGEFEANDCLAEAYVKDDCGAIACIMNDNYGWFSTLDATMFSGEFLENQFRAVFSDEKEHLGELLNQSKSYLVCSSMGHSVYRWCYYGLNLIGDPETPILTRRLYPPGDSLTITSPPNNAKVYDTWRITTHVTGDAIDTVEFWINGELKHTDTTYPYKYYWHTDTYPEDEDATILAKGYDGSTLIDSHTITATVNNYFIFIARPSDEEEVSGYVTIKTETHNVDMVKFYIDGDLKGTDNTYPFQYVWNTKNYSDGGHTLRVEGYSSGQFIGDHEITCQVVNGHCLGTVLLSVLVLLGAAGVNRKH